MALKSGRPVGGREYSGAYTVGWTLGSTTSRSGAEASSSPLKSVEYGRSTKNTGDERPGPLQTADEKKSNEMRGLTATPGPSDQIMPVTPTRSSRREAYSTNYPQIWTISPSTPDTIKRENAYGTFDTMQTGRRDFHRQDPRESPRRLRRDEPLGRVRPIDGFDSQRNVAYPTPPRNYGEQTYSPERPYPFMQGVFSPAWVAAPPPPAAFGDNSY